MLRHPLRLPLLLAYACACASSCAEGVPSSPDPAPRRAFYSWQTTLRLGAGEREALSRLGATRLFLRYFDVDRRDDGTPVPIGKLVRPPDATLPDGLEIVPVVFLRERVFRAPADGLAARVWGEVAAISRGLGVAPREVQLDCDWTDTTREAFFAFAREFGRLAHPATTSATIRLHQVKYRERTGVPPVSRGMLMFYSMGRIAPEPGHRAIFDVSIAKGYLSRLSSYPLPLDVALPIFAWVVHVRDGAVEGLLQATDPASLAAHDALSPAGPERWVATRDTFVDGVFVRAGDELQGETVDSARALEAALLVAPRLPANAPRTIALFDLNERNLLRHDPGGLEKIFDAIP